MIPIEKQLLNIEKQLLKEANKILSERFESEFKTLVNSFGAIHKSESEYENICGQYDGSSFSWVCYFVFPVECDYKLILPKKYWAETKEFRSPSSVFDYVSKFRREEYYSKLKSYDYLTEFIERHTSGASAVISKIDRKPYDENSSKIIKDMNEIEDGRYLYVIYFLD